MAQHGMSRRSTPFAPSSAGRTIPDKLYFRIGEVAALCDVPTYVLRFWESEFPQLKPNKGGTGQRFYRRRDVETALQIRTLLYEEGFTIPGARQAMRTAQRQPEPQLSLAIAEAPETGVDRRALLRLRKEMDEVLKLLAKGSAATANEPVHSLRLARAQRTTPCEPAANDLFP